MNKGVEYATAFYSVQVRYISCFFADMMEIYFRSATA